MTEILPTETAPPGAPHSTIPVRVAEWESEGGAGPIPAPRPGPEYVDWADAVQQAEEAGDEAELARLFAHAEAVEGHPRAVRSWMEAIGGFDASAVTG
ncbi:MAG: hypothetical protein ACOYEV_11420 [Candidatus Nanopelagicales bacterium]